MNRKVNVFYQDLKANQALTALEQWYFTEQDVMYIQDNSRLVNIADMAKSQSQNVTFIFSTSTKTTLNALVNEELETKKFEGYRC